jgi:hypothetical protein
MEREHLPNEQDQVKKAKPEASDLAPTQAEGEPASLPGLLALQQTIGNRAVQRLLAQRSEDEPSELDESTQDRINQERGGGQPLDQAVQTRMSAVMGHDLSSVRVHASPESDDLNRELHAKAFTTGRDIFFRSGAYDPGSGEGQELIAHELTHVVQQSSGAVGGGGRMTVNAPGDRYEQEADATARMVTTASTSAGVQRQEVSAEEEEVQMQPEEEEEGVQEQPEEEEEEEAT